MERTATTINKKSIPFKEYYGAPFASDLVSFLRSYRKDETYAETSTGKGLYRMYHYADRTNDDTVFDRNDDMTKIYFATIFAYMHTFLHVFSKENYAGEYCQCTGFPMICDGSNGIVDAKTTMEKLDTLPKDVKGKKALKKEIEEQKEFMERELEDFTSGRQKADISLYAPSEYERITRFCKKNGGGDIWQKSLDDLETLAESL